MAARYQRTRDGKTLVWNNLRGVADEATWSGARDSDRYATGEGTLTWYRLGSVVNSYTGKMVHGKFEGQVIREQGNTRLQSTFADGNNLRDWSEPVPPSTRPRPLEEKTAKGTPPPVEQLPIEPASPSLTPTPPRSSPTRTPTPIPVPTRIPRS